MLLLRKIHFFEAHLERGRGVLSLGCNINFLGLIFN